MVQLKSFKPLGEGQQEPERRPSSSSSATLSSLATSSNLSTSLGPNLTSSEPSNTSGEQSNTSGEQLNASREHSNTTISSRDEYQMARFELRDSTDESAQEVELSEIGSKSAESRRRHQLSLSPHAPDRFGRPRRGAADQPESSVGINVSQWQAPNPENHFEIRWRNIQLAARKSRLPKFILDSPVYRLLGTAAENKGEQCYSPPIGRHLAGSPKLAKSNQTSAGVDSSGSLSGASPSELRTILNNISGSVFSGQMTAILGPSGVGKTSLLNSLTGRNTLEGSGRVSLIGGASKRMSVVTVPQADILPEKLTALEDLQFTSRLKNPGRHFDHQRNIQRVVRHLQMEKFLNTRIEKLSGGEARRLSIGRELLNSPDIMILDEPTSGLDANTCKKIITALRDIVEHSENYLDRPMSIIVTIHQPQQEVLNLFHRCYVMAQGGCAIFEGPPPGLLPHLLEHSTLASVCPVEQLNENPAIVAIEVASGEYGRAVIEQLAQQHEAQCLEEQLYADEAFQSGQTPLARHNSPYLSTPRSWRLKPSAHSSPVSVSPRVKAGRLREPAADSPSKQQQQQPPTQLDRLSSITSLSYASTYDAELPEQTSRLKVDKRLRRSVVMKGDFVSHTLALMGRSWLLTTRDIFLMSIRILGFLLVAGGIVQIFATTIDLNENVCPVYESEVDDLVGYMHTTRQRLGNLQSVLKQSNNIHMFFFYIVLATTMVTAALDGLVFPLQMRMFRREYKNGWYSPAAFVTSQTLAQLPVDMIGPTLTILITYTLCHQPPAPFHWRQLGYILVLCLSSLICKSQAQIVGAFLMNSVEMSVFLSCVMVCPNALLSGIAVRVSQMSLPLQYFSYGSFLRFAFESLFLMRYGYGICPCDNQTVHGYPIQTSPEAVPPQLDRLARGLIDLRAAAAENQTLAAPTVQTNGGQLQQVPAPDQQDPNLFLAFIRLVTDASNMFPPQPSQLGDCSQYRSLYLMDMNIEDGILPQWISVLVLMFVLSRFLTYFVVKTVIKLRQ